MQTGQNQPFALFILSMEGTQTLNEIIGTFCELRKAPLQIVIAPNLGLADISRQAELLGMDWMVYSFEPVADVSPVFHERLVICDVSPLWETLQLRFPAG